MAEQTSIAPNSKSTKLNQGRERFLAHVIQHALDIERRTPADFVRHFPPVAIMEGLSDQPELRAAILVPTIGTKERIALKKNWQSAGEDLQIALDEGETDAESIVNLFELEDRVRFLDHGALWAFLTEGDFWKASSSRRKELDAAKAHIAFMLERGLEDGLITHHDIVDGITVEELATRLPKSELGKIIQGALESGRGGLPFTEQDLLASMPPEVIVNFLPLAHIYRTVLVNKIAKRHGYVRQEEDAEPAEPRAAEPELAEPEFADAEFETDDEPDEADSIEDLELPPLASSATATDAISAPAPPSRRNAPPPPNSPSADDLEDPQAWSQEFTTVDVDNDVEFEEEVTVG